MRHLCTKETIILRTVHGMELSIPIVRYRELCVVKSRCKDEYLIAYVPTGATLFPCGLSDEDRMIELMIEIDKLANNWTNLSYEERITLIFKTRPLYEAAGISVGGFNPNPVQVPANLNGYDNG